MEELYNSLFEAGDYTGSFQEFKDQLPNNSTILVEDEIKDTRGTRYMLVGRITV